MNTQATYVLYTAFKGSSPEVMDGQAGAEERIKLESVVSGWHPSMLSRMDVSKPVS